MTDQQRLLELVLGSVRQAANHPSVGTAHNLQARAEDIDDTSMFSTQKYNGRVLKSDLSYKPGKPLLKPLPKR